MLKRLLLFCFLFPTLVYAQTAIDRVNGNGQSTFDSLANTTVINATGATPDVSLGNVFITNNAPGVQISNFINGWPSQQITLICADTSTSILNNSHILTGTGSTLSCTANKTFQFVLTATGLWVATGNSGGGGGGSTSPGSPDTGIQFNCAGSFCGSSNLEWNNSTQSLQAIGNGTTTEHKLCGGIVSSTCHDYLDINAATHSITTDTDDTGTATWQGGTVNITGHATLNIQPDNTTLPQRWPHGNPPAGTVLMSLGNSGGLTTSLWSTNFFNGLSANVGSLTTDFNPFPINFQYNNASQIFNGVKWVAQDIAWAPGSFNYQFCGGPSGDICFTIDPTGIGRFANRVGTGDGSAAGSVQMFQGPLPTILPNNVGWGAPTAVDAGGAYGQMPGSPCAGVLSAYTLTAPIYQVRCSGSSNNSLGGSTQTTSLTNVPLCTTTDCPQGEYRIEFHSNANQVCATPGPAAVAWTLTYTDGTGTKTNQTVPLIVNGGVTMLLSEPLGDITHTAYGYAIIGQSGANPITVSGTLTGCTTGTAQFSYTVTAIRTR